MKKLLLPVVALGVLPLLGGCASDIGANPVRLPTGDIVSSATDRFGSWERVELGKTKVAAKIIDTEKAKAEARAEEAKARQKVTITINDKDSMALYQLGEANRMLYESNMMIGKVLKTVVSNGNEYAGLVGYSSMPKGAFAEGFDSFFGGVAKVGNAEATKFLSGGWALKEVLGAVKGNQYSFGGDFNGTDSFNYTEQHQTGSTGNPVLQPLAVEPTVVETVAPEVTP